MKKRNKKLFSALLLFTGFTLMVFSGCGQTPCEDCDITCTDCTLYENHDISACGVNDPLRNIEWLKEYCNGIKEKQKFEKVSISLYKVIGTDENLFRINGNFLLPVSPNTFSDWRNCSDLNSIVKISKLQNLSANILQ